MEKIRSCVCSGGVAMYACGANVALRCVSARLNGIKKARRKVANKPAGVSLCGSWRSERENSICPGVMRVVNIVFDFQLFDLPIPDELQQIPDPVYRAPNSPAVAVTDAVVTGTDAALEVIAPRSGVQYDSVPVALALRLCLRVIDAVGIGCKRKGVLKPCAVMRYECIESGRYA